MYWHFIIQTLLALCLSCIEMRFVISSIKLLIDWLIYEFHKETAIYCSARLHCVTCKRVIRWSVFLIENSFKFDAEVVNKCEGASRRRWTLAGHHEGLACSQRPSSYELRRDAERVVNYICHSDPNGDVSARWFQSDLSVWGPTTSPCQTEPQSNCISRSIGISSSDHRYCTVWQFLTYFYSITCCLHELGTMILVLTVSIYLAWIRSMNKEPTHINIIVIIYTTVLELFKNSWGVPRRRRSIDTRVYGVGRGPSSIPLWEGAVPLSPKISGIRCLYKTWGP